VDDDTYAAAHEAFGDRGLVEMLTLIGCYLSVCALLNAFAIPVPDARSATHEENAR
jgi:4-carboxymuconolactone decarboxylase